MVNQTFETSGEPAPGCMNKARLNAQRCVKMCYRGKRDSSNSLSPSFGDILSYGGWKPKILMSIWKQTHVVPAVSKFTRAQGFWQIHMYTEVDLVWRRWREIMIYIYIYITAYSHMIVSNITTRTWSNIMQHYYHAYVYFLNEKKQTKYFSILFEQQILGDGGGERERIEKPMITHTRM